MASSLSQSPLPTLSTSVNLNIEQPAELIMNQDTAVAISSTRAQWLRAAVLGANDGLLSTSSLMLGVGAVKKDIKTVVIAGIAGLIAGAFSMAVGELMSVYSQYDIDLAQIKRDIKAENGTERDLKEKKKHLPNPFHAALASAVSFSLGAAVPLLAAAFIREYALRVGVVVAAVSLALLGFGWSAAVLGRVPPVKSSLRLLIGGCVAMGVTYGLTKLVGSAGM